MMQFQDRELHRYLELLVRALRGARSTLRVNDTIHAATISEIIDLPRGNLDEVQMFLLKAHQVILECRDAAYQSDLEAASLLDAVHNIPYGLLQRFDGIWDWKEVLPDLLQQHESTYLSGLRKYSGMLKDVAIE